MQEQWVTTPPLPLQRHVSFLLTSLVAHRGGRAGTQKAINSQKCELWMCVQFPPKNKEKIRKSARTRASRISGYAGTL